VLDLALSRQAQVMSYNDAFLLILVFMVATAPLLALLSRRAGNEKGTR
jgi:hypothetical protein